MDSTQQDATSHTMDEQQATVSITLPDTTTLDTRQQQQAQEQASKQQQQHRIRQHDDACVLPSELGETRKTTILQTFQTHIRRKNSKIKVKTMAEWSALQASTWQKIQSFFRMVFLCFFGWCMPKRKSCHNNKQVVAPHVKYMEMNHEQQVELHKLMMDLAYALVFYGSAVYRVEFHCHMIATHFEMKDLHFSLTPNSLFFSFKPNEKAEAVVQFVDLKGSGIDMTRLTCLDDVARALAKGKCSLEEAHNEIKNIISMKPRFLILAYLQTIFFNAMLAGVFGIFFDCNWIEILACIVAGLVVGLVMTIGARIIVIAKSMRFVAGLLACLVGVATKAIIFWINQAGNTYIMASSINEALVFIAAVVILLPGLTMYIAMAEISAQHISSGTTRLISAAFNLLQLGFGLLIGTKFSAIVGLPATSTEPRVKYPAYAYFAALPGIFISILVLLKAPKYPFVFFFVTIASYVALSCSYFLSIIIGREISALLGSFLVCVIGNIYNRTCSHPSNIVITNSVIVLLPGSLGVKTLQSLFIQDSVSGINFAYSMIMTTVALTAGFVLGNYLIPPKHRLNL